MALYDIIAQNIIIALYDITAPHFAIMVKKSNTNYK